MTLRPAVILTAMALYTAPLMVVQAILLRLSPRRLARALPWRYHQSLCRLLGVRITLVGEPVRDGPCLIAANHASWIDITALSAVLPVSFIAKREVASWPIFGTFARLQRCVFVDRMRRSHAGAVSREMMARLTAGDALVLFAEGTSSDGNRVLPFRTALMAAADARVGGRPVAVQPVSISYLRVHGLPMGRRNRPLFTWYGDMEMAPHIWQALAAGPCDVEIEFHAPVDIDRFADRKALARHCEEVVRAAVIAAVTGSKKHDRA